jgi:oligoribonuclease NrnB/cAMP/cGMP phosphodiesterase (DHH superfamily)
MNNIEFFELIKDKIIGHISDSDTDGISARLIAEVFIKNNCKKYIPFNTVDRSMDEVPIGFYDDLNIVIFSDIAPPSLEYYNDLIKKNLIVFIMDHHITSYQTLGNLPNYIYDDQKCGTKILYDFLTEHKRKQKIILDYVTLVNVYDLWKTENVFWKAAKNLVAVHFGYINWWAKLPSTIANEKFLKIQIDKFINRPEGSFYFTMYEQELIKKAQIKEETNYKIAKKNLQKRIDNKGNKYLYTECTSKLSLVSNRLLKEYKEYEYIAIRGLFEKTKYKFSLRSANGFQVETIAKIYGGGGHPTSSGMELTEEQYHQFKSGKMHLI